jgi:hypothetical protein
MYYHTKAIKAKFPDAQRRSPFLLPAIAHAALFGRPAARAAAPHLLFGLPVLGLLLLLRLLLLLGGAGRSYEPRRHAQLERQRLR